MDPPAKGQRPCPLRLPIRQHKPGRLYRRMTIRAKMLSMRVLLVGLALLLSGCAAEENTFGAGDERFVQTMVELRRAALTATGRSGSSPA